MREYNLEEAEIDSELFLLSTRVFAKFDKEKSSIVPYLRKQLPWHMKEMFKLLDNTYTINTINEQIQERKYYLDEEYYWGNILFEDKWIGKCFTRGEKFVIFTIITSSSNRDLSVQSLSKRLNVNRRTIKKKLNDIKETLEEIYG